MSVIVLGMEMPKVCIQGDWYGNCPMDRTWCAQRFAPKGMTMGQIAKEQQDKLPEWCPLRPLPEKHGRLIDAKDLEKMRFTVGINGEDCKLYVPFVDVAEAIFKCHTIVEAEGD